MVKNMRIWRKRLALLIVVIMIIQLLPLFSFAAVSDITLELSADKLTVSPGDTVKVTIGLKNTNNFTLIDGSKIRAFLGILNYPYGTLVAPDMVEGTPPDDGTVLRGDENNMTSLEAYVIPYASTNGKLCYGGYTSSNATAWGDTAGGLDNSIDIVTITFTVASDAVPQTYDFSMDSSVTAITTVDATDLNLSSNTLSITVTPAAPTALNAVPADNKVDLGWTASTGATAATKYYVYRSANSDMSSATLLNSTGTGDVSYSDTSVTNGTTYYYAIKASEDGTNFSAYSNIVSAAPTSPIPYTYTSDGSKITITGYTGTETAVTIPETIEELPVTVIGSNAFAGNTVMTTVAIPDSVTALNGGSFRGCTALETVSFGAGSQLKYMWTNVFEGCGKLTTIELPATLTTISDYTFKNCTSLESLTMPDTVTLMGQQLFYGCTNLKTVHISTAAPALKTSVFEGCTSLTTITVPESVTTVANRAFYGCTSLAEAKFAGNAPATFGTEVFDAAASDFKVLYNYEKTGWSTPSWNGYTAYPSCTVSYDANGGTGTVPTDSGIYYNGDTVTVQFAELTKEGYSFAGWATSATATSAEYTQGGTTSFAMGTEPVTLYAVWTSTDYAVTYDANGATGGSVPEDTTPYSAGVSTTVLDNTGSLEKTGYNFTGWSMVSDATEADYVAGDSITATDRITLYAVWVPYTYTSSDGKVTITKYTGTETAVTVPETIAKLPVTAIGGSVFAGKAVTAVTLPSSLTSMSNYAFQNCSALTSIAIPDGVTQLSNYLFADCSELTTVSFGSSSQLEYIWTNAFKGCSKLTDIAIPTTVTTISNSAFEGCSALTSITIPDGVTLLGERMFYGCSNLTTVHISAAATYLKPSMFEGCTSLTTITIPEKVASIGNRAFYGCTSLAEAKFAGSAPATFGTEVFDAAASDFKVLYNYGTAGWTTPTWNGYTAYPSCTVSYDANGGTGTVPTDSGIYYNGDTVMVQFAELTKEGYSFAGWATSATATSAEYTQGGTASFAMGTEPVTLYAVWTGNALSYTGGTLTEGTNGTAYTASVATATNGTGTYTYATTSTLPAGLTLSSAGVLSGTPTSAGSYNIVVTATDSGSAKTATATFTLTINPAGTVAAPTASPASGAVEKATTVTLSTATSDATIYYTTDGTDPTTSSNVYSGAITINEAVTIKAIAVKAGYANSAVASFAYTITENGLSYTGQTLAAGTYGVPYTASVATAANGTGTYTYTTASTLPTGLTLSGIGVLSGTPTTTGTYSIVVTAADSGSGETANATFTLTINAPSSSPSGGSSSGSSSSGSSTAAVPTTTVSNSTATTTLNCNVSDGKAVGSVTQLQMDDAISKAQEAAKKTGSEPQVQIKLENTSGANSVEAKILGTTVKNLVSENVGNLAISSGIGTVAFDKEVLKTLSTMGGDISVKTAKADVSALSDADQQQIGSRPVYQFNVTNGEQTISEFGGNVTVTVPYTPASGEDLNSIVIYYINAKGELETVTNGRYDPATGGVVFDTNHFSTYAVGYNKVNFTDVSDADWFSDAVNFIAARDITAGTTATTFSPNASLTRGQFITLVLRAYSISADENSTDNFSDAGDTYYTGYLAAAKRLNITSGIGDNKFAPEQPITRQEMFTMLYNALKVLGQLPESGSGKDLTSDFNDGGSVAAWAQEAVNYLVNAGVVSGDNGRLNPENATTRAEFAQVLYNFSGK